MSQKTNFFVITGPSGVGKDSVITSLKKKMPQLVSVITTTTREMREGETQGNPYKFISREEFESKIKKNDFLEWANVYGNLYGSEYTEIERVKSLEMPALFKIDIQGARTLKKNIDGIFVIFIAPQDQETLARWVYGRGKDPLIDMARRIETAKHELADISEWDAVVVNEENKLEQTVEKVYEVMKSIINQ